MDRQTRNATEERVATINEVNMAENFIQAIDQFGTNLRVSMQFHGLVTAAPAPRERWIIQRRGMEWFLDRRADDGTEQIAVTDLQPGDRRIEASGNLYLNASLNAYYNNVAFSPLVTIPLSGDATQFLRGDGSWYGPITGYGVTLPASPTNAQEFILVDSVTNPSWQHRFRFNGNSLSTFAWEYSGGTPISISGISGSSASTAGTNLPGSITVPRAGEYDVEIGANLDDQNNWQNIALQLWDLTSNTFTGFQVGKTEYSTEVAGEAVGVSGYLKFTNVLAAHTYCLRLYDSNNVSTVSASVGFIKFTPRRVA